MVQRISLYYFFKLYMNIQLNQNKQIDTIKSFIYKEFYSISDNFLRLLHQKNNHYLKLHILPNYFLKKSSFSISFKLLLFYCSVLFKNVTQASPSILPTLHPQEGASLCPYSIPYMMCLITTVLCKQLHNFLLVSIQCDCKFLDRTGTFCFSAVFFHQIFLLQSNSLYNCIILVPISWFSITSLAFTSFFI